MKKLAIQIGVAILVLLAIFWLYRENVRLRDSIELKDATISQIDKTVQDLQFEKKQLKSWLEEKDTEFKQKIDSITSAHNIKLSEVQKAAQAKVSYKESKPDTSFVQTSSSVPQEINKEDTIFKTPFEDIQPCYQIKGLVLAADKNPKIAITDVAYQVEVLSVQYKKKPAWWKFWKWFSKRKVESVTVSTCGNVEVKQVSVKN